VYCHQVLYRLLSTPPQHLAVHHLLYRLSSTQHHQHQAVQSSQQRRRLLHHLVRLLPLGGCLLVLYHPT
jgi:hypothetical protein